MRMTIDVPQELFALAQGRSAREGISLEQFIIRAIERHLEQRRLSLASPLVPADGRKPFDLTNEQIYTLIELL